MPISPSPVRNYLWHPRRPASRPRRANSSEVWRTSPWFPSKTCEEVASHGCNPADRGEVLPGGFYVPPSPSSLSPCLILCRSILPFSASTSAATAAVVFGRSRKDDGLMRNLEVSRPTALQGVAVMRSLELWSWEMLIRYTSDLEIARQTSFVWTLCTFALWAGRQARHQEKYDPCVASKGGGGAGSERGRLFFWQCRF